MAWTRWYSRHQLWEPNHPETGLFHKEAWELMEGAGQYWLSIWPSTTPATSSPSPCLLTPARPLGALWLSLSTLETGPEHAQRKGKEKQTGWQPISPEWEVSRPISGKRRVRGGAEAKWRHLWLWSGFLPFTLLSDVDHLGATIHSRDCVSVVSAGAPAGNRIQFGWFKSRGFKEGTSTRRQAASCGWTHSPTVKGAGLRSRQSGPHGSSLLREYTLGHTCCGDLSRTGGEGRTSQQEGSVGPSGVCSKRHRDGCFPCTQKPAWIGRIQRPHQ